MGQKLVLFAALMVLNSGFVHSQSMYHSISASKYVVGRLKRMRALQQSPRRFLSTMASVESIGEQNGPVIIRSKSQNIFLNLALEQYLYSSLSLDHPVLLTYRNDKTIVIGRHQNPWKECKVSLMKEDGVALCRRASGGGAVYQDLGNTCFSFLNKLPTSSSSKEVPPIDFKTVNNELLVKSLANLGINAEASGRNDLVVNHDGSQFKISGSAYKLKNQTDGLRSLHHGTMLLNVDTEALGRYLTPDSLKLKSKGISSVKSRVANLKEFQDDVSHEAFVDSVEKQFVLERAGGDMSLVSRVEVDNEDALKIKEIKDAFDASMDWEWRFGSSPAFSVELRTKFPWAIVTFQLDAKKGRITQGKVFSDCLRPEFIDAMNDLLTQEACEKHSYTYDKDGVDAFADDLFEEVQQDATLQEWVQDVRNWLQKEVTENAD